VTAPLHKFPEPSPEGRARSKALALNLRPPQSFETFDEGKTKDLLGVARTSLDNAQAILEFTDANRQTARQAGIETIAVEIAALLQGERLERVLDALETSASREKPVQLSGDGLGVLRRLERLAAEAGRNLALYAQTGVRKLAGDDTHARYEAEKRIELLELEERKLELLRKEETLKLELAGVTSARRRAELAAIPELREGQTVASLAGPELSRTGTPLVIRLEGPVMAQIDRVPEKSGWDPLAVVGMFALGAAVLLTIAVVASRD
jgi:hypothetical protein